MKKFKFRGVVYEEEVKNPDGVPIPTGNDYWESDDGQTADGWYIRQAVNIRGAIPDEVELDNIEEQL